MARTSIGQHGLGRDDVMTILVVDLEISHVRVLPSRQPHPFFDLARIKR